MTLKINSQAKYFFGAIIIIALLHYTLMSEAVLGKPQSIFYMDEEITLASWFTSVLAFTTGYFFLRYSNELRKVASKTSTETKEGLITLFTGIFFLLLSFDEYFSVHEYLNGLIKHNTVSDSIFNEIAEFSWMGPLSIIMLVVVWAFIQLIRIETFPDIKRSYVIGLLLFILVLILELTGGRLYGHWTYAWVVGLEETFEMFGIAMFLNGVLSKVDINRIKSSN